MARFNRTFYDLNNERYYCFAVADESIPSALLSDLKLSVPNYTETPFVASVLIRGEVVRVTIVERGQVVATYSSNNRAMLRAGRTYPLKSWKEGYEGVLVFGCLREDVYYAGNTPISEECLTRFQPSAIPYVSIPCTDVRLTGEVAIGGDGVQTRSFLADIPAGIFEDAEESMVIDLTDTGEIASSNPMIFYANGINAFNATDDQLSPIYSIHAVRPDHMGRVFVKFGDHFRIAAIVSDVEEEEEEEFAFVSEIAVGTDITQDMVCGGTSGDTETTPIENCPIEFIKIDHA